MPNRTDLLNHLIKKHGLKTYLEIGLQNADQNFNKIECDLKTSVDPDQKANAKFECTSDEFFETWLSNMNSSNIGTRYFDIVFIDGLHSAEQVKKDFENSLKVLSPNGFIVLHDCNPEDEAFTHFPRDKKGHWNGDVYKFSVQIKHKITVDIDNGCSVIRPYDHNILYVTMPETKNVTWEYFNNNRKELLNLISWHEFVKL